MEIRQHIDIDNQEGPLFIRVLQVTNTYYVQVSHPLSTDNATLMDAVEHALKRFRGTNANED